MGLCPGGQVSSQGRGVSGVYVQGGVHPPLHDGIHPAVNRMTDRCKNITFPQLRLQAVKILAQWNTNMNK